MGDEHFLDPYVLCDSFPRFKKSLPEFPASIFSLPQVPHPSVRVPRLPMRVPRPSMRVPMCNFLHTFHIISVNSFKAHTPQHIYTATTDQKLIWAAGFTLEMSQQRYYVSGENWPSLHQLCLEGRGTCREGRGTRREGRGTRREGRETPK